MHPRSTGSPGVRFWTVQLDPPLSVIATYRYHSPLKVVFSGSPAAVLPRKAYAARPVLPATTSGNVTFRIPSGAPMSTDRDHVAPPVRDVAIIARPPTCSPLTSPPLWTPYSYPKYSLFAASAATEGSLRSVDTLSGIGRTDHEMPLSLETIAA